MLDVIDPLSSMWIAFFAGIGTSLILYASYLYTSPWFEKMRVPVRYQVWTLCRSTELSEEVRTWLKDAYALLRVIREIKGITKEEISAICKLFAIQALHNDKFRVLDYLPPSLRQLPIIKEYFALHNPWIYMDQAHTALPTSTRDWLYDVTTKHIEHWFPVHGRPENAVHSLFGLPKISQDKVLWQYARAAIIKAVHEHKHTELLQVPEPAAEMLPIVKYYQEYAKFYATFPDKFFTQTKRIAQFLPILGERFVRKGFRTERLSNCVVGIQKRIGADHATNSLEDLEAVFHDTGQALTVARAQILKGATPSELLLEDPDNVYGKLDEVYYMAEFLKGWSLHSEMPADYFTHPGPPMTPLSIGWCSAPWTGCVLTDYQGAVQPLVTAILGTLVQDISYPPLRSQLETLSQLAIDVPCEAGTVQEEAITTLAAAVDRLAQGVNAEQYLAPPPEYMYRDALLSFGLDTVTSLLRKYDEVDYIWAAPPTAPPAVAVAPKDTHSPALRQALDTLPKEFHDILVQLLEVTRAAGYDDRRILELLEPPELMQFVLAWEPQPLKSSRIKQLAEQVEAGKHAHIRDYCTTERLEIFHCLICVATYYAPIKKLDDTILKK